MSTEPTTMSVLESEMTSEAPARRRWYRQPIAWVAAAVGVRAGHEEIVIQLTGEGQALTRLGLAEHAPMPAGESARMAGPFLVITGTSDALGGLPAAT